MEKLRFISVFLLAFFLYSCEKDLKEEKMQEVVFSVNHIDPSELKSDAWDIECVPDLSPVTAHITINNVDYYPQVFILGNKLYTQAIKMIPGYYTIQYFALLDEDNVPIMATPAPGSDYEVYIPVNMRIGREFTVAEFEKAEVEVAVLCYEEAYITSFGFTWFYIDRITIRTMCFFGDICMKNAQEYANSLYGRQTSFPGGDQFYDAPAIFEIVVKKNGVEVENSPFSNAAWFGVGEPLCVEYPDRIDIMGEEFTFELNVLVKVGNTFEYMPFHTWTVTDDEKIPVDDTRVVDFVIGECTYNTSPYTLILPPYQYLPEKTNAAISWESYSIGGYWRLEVNNVTPEGNYDFPSSGTFLAWCGDASEDINGGLYDFNVYSSLRKLTAYGTEWPNTMPVTLDNLARVNWLFNNLQDLEDDEGNNLGYPKLTGLYVTPIDLTISTKQAKDLQHAIWLLLGFEYNSNPELNEFPGTGQGGGAPSDEAYDIFNAAEDKTNFAPLPGGYASVLLVANNELGVPDPDNFQLIFTIVDP